MTQSLAISKYEVISDRVPLRQCIYDKNEILIPDFAQTLPKIPGGSVRYFGLRHNCAFRHHRYTEYFTKHGDVAACGNRTMP